MASYQKTTIILLLLVSLAMATALHSSASAKDMTNEEFILELNPTKTKASPSVTPIQTDSNKLHPVQPHNNSLRLKVDTTTIQFGEIHPGEPIVRSLNIEAEATNGFGLIGYEIGNLASSDNQVIPDATCDEGNCTELVSAFWNSPLTYGFGYRVDVLSKCNIFSTCTSSFKKGYFKQLANMGLGETPQTVLHSSSVQIEKGKMSLKINIPNTLENKAFVNTIHLIAIPTLED